MQSFRFGARRSAGDSVDDDQSHYAPSSIYSGPGPAEESPAPSSMTAFTPMPLQGAFYEKQPQYNQHKPAQPRTSTYLNIHDPVIMHLLMETAINDSRDYEILSYDEIERLKKERTILRNKVEATKRKLALETKMRDAAQSLNRLYSAKGRRTSTDLGDADANGHKVKRKSLIGARKNSTNDALAKVDDEYTVSNRKVEEYTLDLATLEKKLEDCQKRILEHTAGILQMTHKGLKKNIRKTELPRSPESMASQPDRTSRMAAFDEFDERSLYQIPDYVIDFSRAFPGQPKDSPSSKEMQQMELMANQLTYFNQRLHAMVLNSSPQEHFEAPPDLADGHIRGNITTHIEAHLGYMAQGLDVMEATQARKAADAEKTMFDSEDQIKDVNSRLNDMLQRTNSVSKTPVLTSEEPSGSDLQSQLAYSATVLDRLNGRIQAVLEQKEILTRQIQQQRELNNKSDAQRDEQFHQLTEELAEAKRTKLTGDQEATHMRNQMNLLIEALDQTKHENLILQQQHESREAQQQTEKKLMADLKLKQDQNTRLQAEMARLENEFDLKSEHNYKQLTVLTKARDQAELDLNKAKQEMERVGSEAARIQTELTITKAELDGAYGTRAQRAADVSMNPAIQGKIDDLQNTISSLQKELKETIDDYEVMTKQNVEAEKARDQLEAKIDELEQKNEALEVQLSEEKLKWMGVSTSAPMETTSTMVLKNEFKKMMRETRVENFKTLKAEQDERRRLEGIIRGLRKDTNPSTPSKTSNARLQPSTTTVSGSS